MNQHQLKTITRAAEHSRLIQDINLKFVASFVLYVTTIKNGRLYITSSHVTFLVNIDKQSRQCTNMCSIFIFIYWVAE